MWRQKRGSSVLDTQPTKVYRRRGLGNAGAGTAAGDGHRPEAGTATAGTGHRLEPGTATAGTGHGTAGSPLGASDSNQHQGSSDTGHRPHGHGSRVPIPEQDSPQTPPVEVSQGRPVGVHASAPGTTCTPSPVSYAQACKAGLRTSSAPGATLPPASSEPRLTPSPDLSAPAGRDALTPQFSGKGGSTSPRSSHSSQSYSHTPSSLHRGDSSSSSSIRPSPTTPQRSTDSSASNGSGRSYSYAARFPEQRSDQHANDSLMKLNLLKFLNGFTRASGNISFYKAQVAAMKAEGNFKFEISFNHLLDHDMDVAFGICNTQQYLSSYTIPKLG